MLNIIKTVLWLQKQIDFEQRMINYNEKEVSRLQSKLNRGKVNSEDIVEIHEAISELRYTIEEYRGNIYIINELIAFIEKEHNNKEH